MSAVDAEVGVEVPVEAQAAPPAQVEEEEQEKEGEEETTGTAAASSSTTTEAAGEENKEQQRPERKPRVPYDVSGMSDEEILAKLEELKAKAPRKLPMPNEDAMTARQKSIDVIIKGKAARVKALREERQERLGSKQEVSEELKQILAPYNERKAAHLEALKTLKVSKDSLVAAVAEISNKQQQLESNINHLKKNFEMKSVGQVDEVISRLEAQLEQGMNTLNDERQILRQIRALKDSRKDVAQVETDYVLLKDLREKKRDLVAALQEKRQAMEVHFLASQEEEDKITEIKQKWVSERQNRRVDFSENKAEADALREEMKELSNQKTEIFEAYKAERSAARQSERAFYEWRDNVRDLEREAWRIEQNRRIEDMRDSILEDLKTNPNAEKVELCKSLIGFLNFVQPRAPVATVDQGSVMHVLVVLPFS